MTTLPEQRSVCRWFPKDMFFNRWRKVGERMRQMDRREFLDRCRQAVDKRSDAVLGWLGRDFSENSTIRQPREPGRFFFTADSVNSILSLLKQRLPGRAEQIVEEAERILQHRFDLLGYRSLDYRNATDSDIDWHWEAVHGKRSPNKVFYRVRYLDFKECGDSKIVWELNRHQHLVTLAKAYRLTGDLRYANEILRQWRHWQGQNRYPIGINWASSLEVSIRSMSWLWTYHLLQVMPGVCGFRDEWLRSLELHGRHIERYLSTYFSPNTHLLGEGVGLFFLGVLCPELTPAERWKALGWQIVLQESERQIRCDGFHFEQSTYYHVYALDLFLHAAVLASLNNVPVPRSFEEKIEKMLSALCLLGRYGPPPQFGDDDGGRLFDPRRNVAQHLLDPLATGAILFHRGDLKAVAGNLCEETLWLLGEDGVRRWDQLGTVKVKQELAALAEAGFYVLASEKTQLFMDAGPMGALGAGHGHADALSICLQSHGKSLLIDGGTFEYVGADLDRDLFRGTGMHNTVQIDGVSQAEVASAFSWRRLTHTTVERWIQGQNFDLLVASHDGYQRLLQPVTHHRWVISLKDGMYLVRDVLGGSGNHSIDIAWYLAPDLQFEGEGVFRSRDSAAGIAFVAMPNSSWSTEIRREMFASAYGQKVPTMALHFTNKTSLPAEFTVVLRTLQGLPQSNWSLRHIEPSELNITQYECEAENSTYSCIFNADGRAWDNGSLSSDAEFVCHKRTASELREQLIFCNGTYASVEGGVEVRCARPVEWAEWVTIDGETAVASSETSAIVLEGVRQPARSEVSTQI